MLLRLSPIPVRPFGHAVHRAPDTERNKHPGYGAAGHSLLFLNALDRCKARFTTGSPCAKLIFLQRRREVGSGANLSS